MLDTIQAAKNENKEFWQLIPSQIDDFQVCIQNLELHQSTTHIHEFSGDLYADGRDGEYLISTEFTISRHPFHTLAGEYLVSVKIPADLASSRQTFYTINEILNSQLESLSGLRYLQGNYWLSNLYLGTDFRSLGRLLDSMARNSSSLASFWLHQSG